MGRSVPVGSQDKDLGDAQSPCAGPQPPSRARAGGGLRSKNQMGRTTLHSWGKDLPDTRLILLVFRFFFKNLFYFLNFTY